MTLFEENEELSKSQIDYLNEIDLEYMRAYSTRTLRYIEKYFTRDCLIKVSSYIHGMGSCYFASSKFRNTKWILESQTPDICVIRKEVTFDKVRIAGSLQVAVADNYKERWIVLMEDNKFTVVDDLKAIS